MSKKKNSKEEKKEKIEVKKEDDIKLKLPKQISKVLDSYEIPKTDGVYCDSFKIDETEKILNFFDHYGFVVIEEALSKQECEDTLSDVYDIIEKTTDGKFKRDDESTWSNWPTDSIERFGSFSRPPIFSKQFLNNRQNKNIYKIFSLLLKDEDIVSNHDRGCFYRPTKTHSEWKTEPNLHLDMNPFDWIESDGKKFEKSLGTLTYEKDNNFIFENNQTCAKDGLMLQGVINLYDNVGKNGGFIIVPGFHKVFKEYFSYLKPDVSNSSYNWSQKNILFNTYAKRVPMKAGSIVVWNQCMAHGSMTNFSDSIRSAQFIKMFPKKIFKSDDQRKARENVIREKIKKSGLEVSEIGKIVFDLKDK